MSDNIEQDTNVTDHAMLVVWGQYAHCLGLPQAFADVPISRRRWNTRRKVKCWSFW